MTWKYALACLAIALVVTGCDSNPTNAPSDQDIDRANAKRAAGIDNDPSLTAQGKADMKKKLHLDGAAPAKPK